MSPTALGELSPIEQHLAQPRGRGRLAGAPHTGAAGGAACGDLVRISLHADGGRVVDAGFEASGCAAIRAAASATVELIEGAPVLDVARISAATISDELGGLAPSHAHAAELAGDALHRALGAAAGDGAFQLQAVATRTLVAMSGGVDSAAAAQLALDAGDDVVAVTLELWSDPDNDGESSCCSPQAVRGARALAQGMGLPHFTLDLRGRFRADVVDDFLAGYVGGATPNPCVRCNGLVRFDSMLELADRVGARRLTTGHYARIERERRGSLVRVAVDERKDQSYVLARLRPETLERLGFPLGELSKPQVRDLARRAGLPVADKPESQDLCFLAGTRRDAFVVRHAGGEADPGAGEIVDSAGTVLGRHGGHHNFTVGQRRGIGIAADEPLYVLAKDARSNRVVVGTRDELATDRVTLGPGRLHRPAAEVDAVRLRYQGATVPCEVEQSGLPAGEHDGIALRLAREVARPAPGQVACLMAGDRVVGWALIGEPEASAGG